MAFRLFGGHVVEDAQKCALQSLLFGCMIMHPRDADRLLTFYRHIASLPGRADGRRRWFRRAFKRHDAPDDAPPAISYVSVSPGGYRVDPPNAPDDIVEDVDAVPPGFGMLDDLSALCDLETAEPAADETMAVLSRAAHAILDGTIDSDFADSRRRFAQVASALQQGADASRCVSQLYEDILLSVRLPNDQFSWSILLLQSQLIHNQWLVDDGYGQPDGWFHAYLDAMGGQRSPAIAGLREYAAGLQRQGAATLQQALASGSLCEFQRCVYLAQHYYYSALMLCRAVGGTDTQKLILDEAYSACFAGIASGHLLYANPPLATAERMVLEINDDIDRSEYLLAQRHSSPLKPFLPRFLFRLFFAYALVLRSAATEQLGIERIGQVEREYSESVGHPHDDRALGWIDLIALNAARHIGDVEEARRRAYRIVGRLTVRRHLQRERATSG